MSLRPGPEPEYVPRIGPFGVFFLRAMILFGMLVGPVTLATIGRIDESPRTQAIVGGLFTAVFTPVCVWAWRAAGRARARTRRLDRSGIPAAAEVLASVETPVGEGAGVALTLRISGPGLPSFDAVHECGKSPSPQVGEVLFALVDPAGRLFTIDHGRPAAGKPLPDGP
ncbi:hypothetical protein [Streptomyces sp. CAU 1734]|uniref:hypothetical protein n=1 Tax=Streptomyces sp. CAU 1734 TaxID=3140360 RepID=UPI00326006A9